jgi:hypothetical protein
MLDRIHTDQTIAIDTSHVSSKRYTNLNKWKRKRMDPIRIPEYSLPISSTAMPTIGDGATNVASSRSRSKTNSLRGVSEGTFSDPVEDEFDAWITERHSILR